MVDVLLKNCSLLLSSSRFNNFSQSRMYTASDPMILHYILVQGIRYCVCILCSSFEVQYFIKCLSFLYMYKERYTSSMYKVSGINKSVQYIASCPMLHCNILICNTG